MTTAGKKCIELNQPLSRLREWLLHWWPLRRPTTETQSPKANVICIPTSRKLRNSVQPALDMGQKRSYDQTIGLAKHLLDQHWRTL